VKSIQQRSPFLFLRTKNITHTLHIILRGTSSFLFEHSTHTMRVCNCISHLTWINFRFHGDGLGSSCSSESYDFTEDFLYVATSSISLLVVLAFTMMGCRGLYKIKSMPCTLKFIFVMASASSVAITVLSVVTIGLCLSSHKKTALITASISTFVYAFLFLCIWANLTVRLFVAFRESVFKINRRQQIGYKITFFFLLLNAFAASACQLLMLVGEGLDRLVPSIWVQFTLGIVFMVVFAVSALCVVVSFLDKLFILGKARTKKQVKVFCETEPIGLNKMQQKLMNLSSKYISLFLMASFSSFITMFSGFYESASDLRISLFLVPVDCCVNLICIYLQYEFAVSHYTKCCGKLDRCCKYIMTKTWVDSIHSDRREERNLELKEIADEKIATRMKVVTSPHVPSTIPEEPTLEGSVCDISRRPSEIIKEWAAS
jgi:hypothetical protein